MNEKILNELYIPNDGLGVKLFGVNAWNGLKGRAAGLTNSFVNGSYIPTYPKNNYYTPLFSVLFRPQKNKFNELLGAEAPIDFLSYDWARGLSNIGHGVTEILEKVPVTSPFISAGRSVNQGMADIMKAFGMSPKKAEDVAPVVVKTGAGLGVILLIGGGIWAVYHFSKKKRK